jgi:hypothetical protein
LAEQRLRRSASSHKSVTLAHAQSARPPLRPRATPSNEALAALTPDRQDPRPARVRHATRKRRFSSEPNRPLSPSRRITSSTKALSPPKHCRLAVATDAATGAATHVGLTQVALSLSARCSCEFFYEFYDEQLGFALSAMTEQPICAMPRFMVFTMLKYIFMHNNFHVHRNWHLLNGHFVCFYKKELV